MGTTEQRNGYAQLQVTANRLTLAEVRRVAVTTFGEPGGHLVDLWKAYNGRFFNGDLPPVLITRTSVFAYGRCIGLTTYGSEKAIRHIQVKKLGPVVTDAERGILLHEMLHQSLHERGLCPKHAGQPWCSEIMRISRDLGYPVWAGQYKVIREGKRTRRANATAPADGAILRSLTQREIGTWPHSIGLNPPDER